MQEDTKWLLRGHGFEDVASWSCLREQTPSRSKLTYLRRGAGPLLSAVGVRSTSCSGMFRCSFENGPGKSGTWENGKIKVRSSMYCTLPIYLQVGPTKAILD